MVTETTGILSNKINEATVYPNPVKTGGNINYTVTETSHITLKVFDINGEKIRTVIDKQQSPGNYNAKLQSNGMSAGIYFYVMTSDKTTVTGKFVVEE